MGDSEFKGPALEGGVECEGDAGGRTNVDDRSGSFELRALEYRWYSPKEPGVGSAIENKSDRGVIRICGASQCAARRVDEGHECNGRRGSCER